MGETPTHLAASNGDEGCLRVLHKFVSIIFDPLLKGLSHFHSATGMRSNLDVFDSATIKSAIDELEERTALATCSSGDRTPAHEAAAAGHTGCARFLSEIGGTAALLHDVQADPELLEDEYSCLLLEPRLQA
jgi:hypothetical protein